MQRRIGRETGEDKGEAATPLVETRRAPPGALKNITLAAGSKPRSRRLVPTNQLSCSGEVKELAEEIGDILRRLVRG